MAYIEPNTEIRFLSGVPLDPDYENTLYFDSVTAQTLYFATKSVRRFTNQSYQRKTRGWLRVGWSADAQQGSVIADLYNSNYMMFKNTNFENKWFYAFVDRVEYVNNNCVEVQYHIDVMQTWHFDYVLNQCFIERQHTTGDTPGVNTIPENIEQGPYESTVPEIAVDGNIYGDGRFPYTPQICLITTTDEDDTYADGYLAPGLNARGNYFTGVNYRTFNTTQSDIDELNELLADMVGDADKDAIVSLLMVPGDFFNSSGNTSKTVYLQNSNRLGLYTPRNKKLLTYPYNCIYVYTPYGHNAEYKYEDFASIGERVSFRVWGNISANHGLLCAPNSYKGVSGTNYEEMTTLTGFPMCSWSYDAYKAWLAQNSGVIAGTAVNLTMSWMRAIGTGLNAYYDSKSGYMLTGKAAREHQEKVRDETLDTINEGSRALGATAMALGVLYDHSRKPPQMVGNTQGDLNYQAGLCTFSFVQKHIKPEYARIIDDFFDMYGYAIHRNGVPNRAARPCYTYVKTIGCSIHGDIPADDTVTIQNIFNNGIRFWKSNAVFGNYDPTVNNNAV